MSAGATAEGMQLYDAQGRRQYLMADRVNLANGTIVFASPKKRRAGLYRAVPTPRFANPRASAQVLARKGVQRGAYDRHA